MYWPISFVSNSPVTDMAKKGHVPVIFGQWTQSASESVEHRHFLWVNQL